MINEDLGACDRIHPSVGIVPQRIVDEQQFIWRRIRTRVDRMREQITKKLRCDMQRVDIGNEP